MASVAGRVTLRGGQSRDLISRRVRRELRELSVGTGTLRTIGDAFADEGFDFEGEPDFSDGMRRGLFDAYDQGIDWSDRRQVASATRVFEEILSWGLGEDFIGKLKRLLGDDGYSLDDQLRIRPTRSDMPALRSEHIGDATVLHEYLARLNGAIEDDPALAISQAKSLIEVTSKWVLEQLGTSYDDKATIPALVKKV